MVLGVSMGQAENQDNWHSMWLMLSLAPGSSHSCSFAGAWLYMWVGAVAHHLAPEGMAVCRAKAQTQTSVHWIVLPLHLHLRSGSGTILFWKRH